MDTITNVKDFINEHGDDLLAVERWIASFQSYREGHERGFARFKAQAAAGKDPVPDVGYHTAESVEIYERELKTDDEAIALLNKALPKAAEAFCRRFRGKEGLVGLRRELASGTHLPAAEDVIKKAADRLAGVLPKEPKRVECEYCGRTFLEENLERHYQHCRVKKTLEKREGKAEAAPPPEGKAVGV